MNQLSRWWFGCVIISSFAVMSLAAEEHTARMELRHNMPFVQVMVNGKGPFTFGIDTGTGGEALVTAALVQQLNLPEIGKAEVGDPSGRNQKEIPLVELQSLQVAGIEFHKLRAAQFEPSTREGQIDGILGFPLFAKYVLTLDYPAEQMKLATGSLTSDGGKTVVPFTMPNNVPIIELTVGSQHVEANVDSRGGGLSLPEKFAGQLKFASEPVVIGRGRTVSNEFQIKGAELAEEIQVGTYTFPHPFVVINPVLPLGNFGAAALRNFAVTFDEQNKLMRLESAQKSIVIAAPVAKLPAAKAASK